MHRRPWFIVILAMFHWFAPVGNILFSASIYRMDLSDALHAAVFQSTALEFFKVFLLMPLAGTAIYAYKRWSYAAFVVLNLLSFYFNFTHWRIASDNFSLTTLFGSYALNFLVVGYFLLPRVRKGYFDPKLRWWEKKPRYAVDIFGEVSAGSSFKYCQITDLSETGLFMQSQVPLQMGNRVVLRFNFLNTDFELKAVVAQVKSTADIARTYGFGLKFEDVSRKQIANLRKVICVLSMMKVSIRTNNVYWFEDFRDWMFSLFTTGQGILPQYTPPEAPFQIHTGVKKALLKRKVSNKKKVRKSARSKRAA